MMLERLLKPEQMRESFKVDGLILAEKVAGFSVKILNSFALAFAKEGTSFCSKPMKNCSAHLGNVCENSLR